MSDPSWTALQIAEQLRSAEVLLSPAITIAAALDVETARQHGVLIAADDVSELKRSVEALAELSGQLVGLSEHLTGADLEISCNELVVAAANDLSSGIMDPVRVRLAARVLPVGIGWPALAAALSSTDTHTAWNSLTVGELLAAFCDVEDDLVERVLAAAEMSVDDVVASCEDAGLRRLAAALEEHAPAQ